MARPQKQTVDYFPHDANASEGDTLTILQSRFGNDGYAFWFKLLEKISSSENHVIDCRNPVKWQLLLAKTSVNKERGLAIMEVLCELEAIDAQLWRERKIIWCQNLVNNIADVYKNRNRPVPERPVSTNSSLKIREQTKLRVVRHRERKKLGTDNKNVTALQDKVSTNNNLVSTTDILVSGKKAPVSSTDKPQSKVKETKVNNNYTVVFKLWNSLEIIKHKKLTADIKRAIDRALRDSSLEVVSQAIKNYAEILKGDQYYFKYSWTLKDFLKRGLDKFLDLEIAKRNYGGDRDGTHRGHTTKLPPRGGYTKPRPNPKLDKLVEQGRAAGRGAGSNEPG